MFSASHLVRSEHTLDPSPKLSDASHTTFPVVGFITRLESVGIFSRAAS